MSDGTEVKADLNALIAQRLLIAGNSGSGKSYLLRLIAELICTQMPVIIFDLEGEFATLREKFDFLLVGSGGETALDIRTAKVLMQRILEHRVSAIFDLSEMEKPERERYVKAVCEAAINSPKNLWRPTCFIFDESHELCPESSKGQSECKAAVLAFPAKGRKRRFMSVFATQRLHKLSLDARAEMLNRLIGMMFESDDIEQAAKLAGIFGKEELMKFREQMRSMEAGNFYGFGRAISIRTILFKTGKVQTTHGQHDKTHKFTAPPPTKKIMGLLPQLADLPSEAKEEAERKNEDAKLIQNLRHELNTVRADVLLWKKVAAENQSQVESDKINRRAIDFILQIKSTLNPAVNSLKDVQSHLDQLRDDLSKKTTAAKLPAPEIKRVERVAPIQREPSSNPRTIDGVKKLAGVSTDGKPSAGLRRIMISLAQCGALSRKKIGVRTGLVTSSGTFGTYISSARTMGWIAGNDDALAITQTGLDVLGSYEQLPTGRSLYVYWMNQFGAGGVARILQAICESYPAPLSKHEVAERAGLAASSGTFGTYLSTLRGLDLITGKDSFTAAADLF